MSKRSQPYGWAARIRVTSMADDALGTLLAHRGLGADMFVCPGRSLKSLQSEKHRRSVSVADFRREEDRPSQKRMDAPAGRLPIRLRIPKGKAGRGDRAEHTSHVATPHPVTMCHPKTGDAGLYTMLDGNRGAETRKGDMSFVLDADTQNSSPGKFARFVAHQKSSKFGRSWGKFNPVHLPIVQGVQDVEEELTRPNFGCRQVMRASKIDFAKLNDRRSGNMAIRDGAGTLHSTLSYSAFDPYGRYKETYNPEWSGKMGGSAPSTPKNGALLAEKRASDRPSGTKRLAGKPGGVRVHIPMGDERGGDVPTYNVTNAIASGLPSTQILNSSLLLSRKTGTDFAGSIGFAGGAVWQ